MIIILHALPITLHLKVISNHQEFSQDLNISVSTWIISQGSEMESTNDVKLMTGLGLKSNISTASADKSFYYQRGLASADGSKPILVLIHGYPQT